MAKTATGPLHGIRVIDITTTLLGPLASQLLGDLGADVIKVEPPGGEPMRSMGAARHPGMAAMYLNNNRNKRSLMLDLKQPAAREAMTRLIESSDVLLHNMRRAAAERLGLGYADVSRVNPRIVYASAGGYRLDGPRADLPAFDDVIQGVSGIPDLFIKSGREPQFAPFAAADKVSAYLLASSVGMALLHRERTGEGQEVHVPMMEAMLSFNLHEHLWNCVMDPPVGPPGYARMMQPHRRPFKTRDGYVVAMPVTDEQWARMLNALGRPDLAADERWAKMEHRSRNFHLLYQAVTDVFEQFTTGELVARLESADIPYGRIPTLEELLSDEYLESVGAFHRYEHPTEGKLMTIAPPVYFSRTPVGVHRHPPNLGEHNREILAELGYGDDEIDAMSGTRRP